MPSYFDTLFDADEHVCFAPSRYGTDVSPRNTVPCDVQYLSVNALDPTRDRNPQTEKHSPDRPRRADHNVTVFRNFLLESDTLRTSDLDFIRGEGWGQWISARVSSGGKSEHWVISLDVACKDEAEFRRLGNRLHLALSRYDFYARSPSRTGDAKAKAFDPACRNPSRLTRYPGVIRHETGKEQTLLECRGRVSKSALESFLDAKGIPRDPIPARVEAKPHGLPGVYLRRPLPLGVLRLLRDGWEDDGRKNLCFWLACRFLENDWPEDEALGQILEHTNLDEQTAEQHVSNAYRYG